MADTGRRIREVSRMNHLYEREHMEKLNIAVLFGGRSPEYKISLMSAYSVITHMDAAKYETVLLGVTQGGEWFFYTGPPERIRDDSWQDTPGCVRAIISPDRETHGVLVFDEERPRAIRLDAAMPLIHGRNGEDGSVQGLLQLADIPVVGCKTLASALCMDKNRAHKVVKASGLRVARSFTLQNANDMAAILEQAEGLGYPLFVKPVRNGSSYGITKVQRRSELLAAVKFAFEYDNEVIVEENIPGFEVGCAVLGDDFLIVGDVDEIELADGFLDFKEKYTPETSCTRISTRIGKAKSGEIKETAKTIYRALGCTGFARVDMFLTPSEEIVFSEVNTIPGFTAHSRYPNMLKSIGMSFGQVVNAAIDLAVSE